MNEFLFSDIETNKFMNKSELRATDLESYGLKFKLGCIINYDVINHIEVYRKSFENVDDYLNFICNVSRNKKRIIFYHNLSFDSLFIIEHLISRFDYVKPIRANSKILSIRCFKTREITTKRNGKYYKKYQNDCLLELRDSLAILLVSIEKLGIMVKCEKHKTTFDYENDLEKVIEYCFQDCKIIYLSLQYLLDFLNEFFNLFWKFKDLPLTVASLSKKLIILFYPRVFYPVDKYFERTVREYYFGGRTEAFNFNLLKNGLYLDINSLYPFVLSNNMFSYGKVFRFFTNTINFSDSNVLAFEVDIIENNFYPLYPIRIEKKVFFLNGKKRVIMTKPEYYYFLENNYFSNGKIEIVKVISVFYTNQTICFSLFFKELYYIRKKYDSKHPYNYFIKILLNSGYGKFGQKSEQSTYEFITDINNFNDSEFVIDFNDAFLREKKKLNGYMLVNLFNAVLTTSYARFELWKMLMIFYERKISVFYVDTDSIVISKNDLEKVKEYLNDNKLGSFKIENDFDLYQCIDSKEYFSLSKDGFKAKFKGIPFEISKEKVFENKKDIMEHIKSGTKINEIGSFFYAKIRKTKPNTAFVINKHKNSYFFKRKILFDLSTIPLTINDNFEQIELENKEKLLKHLENIEF